MDSPGYTPMPIDVSTLPPFDFEAANEDAPVPKNLFTELLRRETLELDQGENGQEENLPSPVAPLTADEATILTETIRATADMLWVLMWRAHEGKAHKALGYSSWAVYVREEFSMSRSRSYQILDQAKVINAVEKILPSGTIVSISEAAARSLKTALDEVLPIISSKTKSLSSEEAAVVVSEVIEEHRDLAKTDSVRVLDEFSPLGQIQVLDGVAVEDFGEFYDFEFEEAEEYEDMPILPEVDILDLDTLPHPDFDFLDDDIEPERGSLEEFETVYEMNHIVQFLAELPEDFDAIINVFSEEHAKQVSEHLNQAKVNFERFLEVWEKHQTDSS